ncbi:MAG: hypothetical protein GY802_09220, partial [Gammaproteobacteria bacterium]|nr:hypothetical protein [Gammaproteobacteria bacterium]
SMNDGKIAWYENDGSESFTDHIITTAAIGALFVTTTDVDGDGDLDVLSASQSDGRIAWYENDGSESFTTHTITTAANGAFSIATADVDGDGDMDVLSASMNDDKIAWYENNGSEVFTERVITTGADGAVSVTTADVDGDGDIDVLSASTTDNKIAWYENDGSETFTTHTITTGVSGAFSVTTADVDGDGDLDVLSASIVDQTVAWYENIPVTTLDGAPTFIEDGAAVVMDADVQIFDAELASLDNFDGASLTLVRNGGASAEDVFSNSGLLGALTESGALVYNGTTIGTVTTNSGGTLVLTFNTNATSALVDSTLQSIAYSNSSDAPPASAQIDWSFDDGNSGSQGTGGALQATGSTTVTITAVNDAPVVTAPGSALAATEQVGLSIGGTGFGVSDFDEAGSGATATLIAGEGAITIVSGDSGVTIDSGNGTGTVVVSGTIAQINNLLTAGGTGTITYLNGSDTPSASTIFTVTVNDGGNTGADPGLTGDGISEEGTNSQTINITATNDVVAGVNDSVNTNEDTPLIFNPTTNDTDAEWDSISVVEFTQPANGAIVDNGDGTLTYTPTANYNGPDSFN